MLTERIELDFLRKIRIWICNLNLRVLENQAWRATLGSVSSGGMEDKLPRLKSCEDLGSSVRGKRRTSLQEIVIDSVNKEPLISPHLGCN